ncbi:hypothetical protein BDB13_5875 [Rhodococcus sp. OK302]|nr:hypothetical protein BDB13_5875 [Rhodococcus sp. OK302]
MRQGRDVPSPQVKTKNSLLHATLHAPLQTTLHAPTQATTKIASDLVPAAAAQAAGTAGRGRHSGITAETRSDLSGIVSLRSSRTRSTTDVGIGNAGP